MWPGLSLYFAALLSRLAMTWAMRIGSATSQIGSVGSDHGQLVLLCVDQGASGLDAASHHVGQLHPLLAKLDLPRMIRDTSKKSSISRTM